MSGPALPHPFDLAPPLPTALATPSPSLLGDYVAFTSSTNLHPMIASLASTALNELVRCSQQPGRSLEATLNQCWLHLLVLHRQYNPVWESAVVWRGSYWQTANTLLSITGDVDVSEWQVKGKPAFDDSADTSLQFRREEVCRELHPVGDPRVSSCFWVAPGSRKRGQQLRGRQVDWRSSKWGDPPGCARLSRPQSPRWPADDRLLVRRREQIRSRPTDGGDGQSGSGAESGAARISVRDLRHLSGCLRG